MNNTIIKTENGFFVQKETPLMLPDSPTNIERWNLKKAVEKFNRGERQN